MEQGDWFREKTFNQRNGKDEWKYYYVRDLIPENNDAEIDIYRIYYNGRVSEPRKGRSPAELIEKMTKVSGDYACSVLKITPPQQL